MMVGNSREKDGRVPASWQWFSPARGASRGDEFARGDAAAHHFLHSGASKLNFNQSITMSLKIAGTWFQFHFPLNILIMRFLHDRCSARATCR